VDDSERLPSGHLPTPNDGGRQALLATPPHDPQRGKRLRELDRNRPRSIGTVVVDDDELVVPRKRLIERCREALEERSQIGRFVIGWNHQREPERGRSVLYAQSSTGCLDQNIVAAATLLVELHSAHRRPPSPDGCAKAKAVISRGAWGFPHRMSSPGRGTARRSTRVGAAGIRRTRQRHGRDRRATVRPREYCAVAGI